MFVKPKYTPVYDPENGDFIPVEGREVPNEQYWYRRLNDGDIVEAKPKKEAK